MKRRAIALVLSVLLAYAFPASADAQRVERTLEPDDTIVYIDAETYIPDRREYPVYEVTTELWGEYDIPAIFMGDQDYEMFYQDSEARMYPYYVFGDGTAIYLTSGAIFYDTELGAKLYGAYSDMACREIAEVAGLSADEALNMVGELAEQLDVELLLDAECVTALSCSVELNGGIAPQEFYYMQLQYSYDGVRISPETFYMGSIDYMARNGVLEALVSARGLESLSIGRYYRVQKVHNEAEALALDEALTRFEAFVQSLFLEESFTITRIALQYVPLPNPATVDNELLVPAWTFYTDEQSPYVYFNALTGELII